MEIFNCGESGTKTATLFSGRAKADQFIQQKLLRNSIVQKANLYQRPATANADTPPNNFVHQTFHDLSKGRYLMQNLGKHTTFTMTDTLFISSVPVGFPLTARRSSTCSRFSSSRRMFSNSPPSDRVAPATTFATIAAPAPRAAPSPSPQHAGGAGESERTFEPGIVYDIRTPEEFDRLQEECNNRDVLLVADFMAKWCRKCKYLLPRFRKLAAKHTNAMFCTIDVNGVARLPRQFSIAKMPTFIFLKQGEAIETLIGGSSPESVASQLQSTVERLS